MKVARGWREGETGELLFNKYKISVLQDEKTFCGWMDGGGGCKTM